MKIGSAASAVLAITNLKRQADGFSALANSGFVQSRIKIEKSPMLSPSLGHSSMAALNLSADPVDSERSGSSDQVGGYSFELKNEEDEKDGSERLYVTKTGEVNPSFNIGRDKISMLLFSLRGFYSRLGSEADRSPSFQGSTRDGGVIKMLKLGIVQSESGELSKGQGRFILISFAEITEPAESNCMVISESDLADLRERLARFDPEGGELPKGYDHSV